MPAELDARHRRQLPERDEAVDVRVGALDAAHPRVAVILDDEVVREERANPSAVASVERVGQLAHRRRHGGHVGIDRRPARPRLALRGACVVDVEQHERA